MKQFKQLLMSKCWHNNAIFLGHVTSATTIQHDSIISRPLNGISLLINLQATVTGLQLYFYFCDGCLILLLRSMLYFVVHYKHDANEIIHTHSKSTFLLYLEWHLSMNGNLLC